MKKFLSMLLLIAMLTSTLVACGGDEEVTAERNTEETVISGNNNQSGGSQGGNQENNQNGGSQGGGQGQDSAKLAEVYEKYPNLVEIGEFHNGLALFVVEVPHDYLYNYSLRGYIDVSGNIVIEPQYYEAQSFENVNYVLVQPGAGAAYQIIDKEGKTLFEEGKDGVCCLGANNGYFNVVTEKEELTGNIYTYTYYSAKNMNVVASFESLYYSEGYRGYYDVDNDGTFYIIYGEYGSEREKYNIADYDPDYNERPNPEATWNVDLNNIEAFQGVPVSSYMLSDKGDNSIGQIATVTLVNRNNVRYYATVDQNGTILMQAQKEMKLSGAFYKDLCLAQDLETGLWGYVDPYGNWKIQPQYENAGRFTKDGYAIVDTVNVIDTMGKTVLSANWLSLEDICGTWSCGNYTIILTEKGTITLKRYSGASSGDYTLSGQLNVTGLSYSHVDALRPNDDNQNGNYSIKKEGDKLIINGRTWTKVPTE